MEWFELRFAKSGEARSNYLDSEGPFWLLPPAGWESFCFIISLQRTSIASLEADVLEGAARCCAALRARLMTSQSGPASACAAATPSEMKTIVLRVECMMIFPIVRIGSAGTGSEHPCSGRATEIEHVAKVRHAWG